MSLTAFKQKETKSKTTHPVLPDPDQELVEMVDEVVSLNTKIEQLTAKLKDSEGVLKEVVHNYMFTHFNGKSEVPSSIKVQGIEDAVLVQMTSRTTPIKVEPKNSEKIAELEALVPHQLVENEKLEIDGNQIPKGNRESFYKALSLVLSVFGHLEVLSHKQAEFNDELELAIEMGGYDHSDGNPSEACVVSQTIAAKSSLHMERHRILSPQGNAKLQELLKYVVSVKKKGVK